MQGEATRDACSLSWPPNGAHVTSWNYADVLEAVAAVHPRAVAVRHGDRELTYGELLARADGLGQRLAARGAALQDKVGVYLYNSPEYVIASVAALHARLVPVNTNYRYGDDELAHLWDNADCFAVVFHGTFTDRVARLRVRCPRVTTWVHVDDGSAPCPPWAEPFDAMSAPSEQPSRQERSGDDLVLLYTGGTTGMPKGVMWPQDDLFRRLNGGGVRRYDHERGLDALTADLRRDGVGPTIVVTCPLMHGTGLFSTLECLVEAGTVVLLASRRFDADELLDTIAATTADVVVIVGDPFARPMLESLRANGRQDRIGSLKGIVSSGAMWSEEIKRGLLEFNGSMLLIDGFSSSEALGMGNSVMGAGLSRHTAEFTLGEDVRVLAEDGTDVVPGSDVPGMLALGGRLPLGYYKDASKTEATFKTIDGRRYSVPGDWAKVREDGTILLLGRGSQCINTAGEKVFPEEVEEALKTHPSVADACVLGTPDQRWGEVVMAVVEPRAGASPDEAELIDHVKGALAHYKAPHRIRVVESIGRTPAGKMDYARHRTEMAAWLIDS
jgi:3-oxocholest-4-en-26-oate---CoA ligase